MVRPTMYRFKLLLTVMLGVAMGSLLYKMTSVTSSLDEEDQDEPLDENERFEREKRKYFKNLDMNLKLKDDTKQKQTEDNTSSVVILEKSCGKFAKPGTPVKDGTFQVMEDFHIYMYSAYLDLRVEKTPVIRILGVSIVRLGILYCQLYHDDGSVYSTRAIPHDLDWQGNTGKPFSLIFQSHMYLCSPATGRLPYAVALTRTPCEQQTSHLIQLQVRQKTAPPQSKPTFMVCLHKFLEVRSPYRLIEFLEYQKLLGVSAVVGYKYFKANPAVTTAMEFYEKQGFLRLLPWGVDKDKFQKPFELIQQQTFGPSIQLLDCLYRYMNNYTYIIPSDISQFIVPVQPNITNYPMLLNEVWNKRAEFMSKKKRKKLAVLPGQAVDKTRGLTELNSVSVPVSKFCLTQMQHISEKPESVLFQIYRRDDLGMKATTEERKKMRKNYQCIMNPRRTVMIHDTMVTTSLKDGRKPVPAAPSVVLSHSYNLYRSKECKQEDRTAENYKQPLTDAVNKVCEKLNLEKWPH